MRRKPLIIVLVVVALFATAAVLVLVNIETIIDRNKDVILARAESEVGRKIDVDHIGAAFWPAIGIRLDGVTIADDPAFSADPFLTVKDVLVTIQIRPLLRKELVVKRLVLTRPDVRLIRNENGVFNYASMMAPAAGSDSAAAAKSAAAVPLILAFADVEEGTLRFVDRARSVDHTVRDISASANNVQPGREIDFNVQAAVFSDTRDVRISGKIGPIRAFEDRAAVRAAPVSIQVDAGPVAAAQIIALMPADSVRQRVESIQPGDVTLACAITGTPGSLRVESCSVSLPIFGASEPNVSLSLATAPFDAMPPAGAPLPVVNVTGDARISALDAGKLAAMSPPPKGGKPAPTVAGTMSATVKFHGTRDAMEFECEIDADAVSVAVVQQFHKAAGTTARVSASGTARGPVTDIASLEIRFHDMIMVGSGSLGEAVKVNLAADNVDIGAWKGILPAIAPFEPTGIAAIKLSVDGAMNPATPPPLKGTLSLRNLGAKLAQVPSAVSGGTATIAFTATSARVVESSFKVGRSAVRMTADIKTFDPVDTRYHLTVAEAYRDDFQAPPPKPFPRPEILRDVVVDGTATGKTAADMENRATLTSARGTVANIDYTDLRAKVDATPSLVRVESYSARAMDGTVSGDATFEPLATPPRFKVFARMDRVNLSEYFRYKFPDAPKVIEGRINMDLDIAGAGDKWESIAPTLSGTGSALVGQGILHNINIVAQFIDGIQSIPMVPAGFSDKMRARHPDLFRDNSTAFDKMDTKVAIRDGRVTTDALNIDAKAFVIKGAGSVGLDRAVKLAATVSLSKALTDEIVAELPAAKYLLGGDGRIAIPLAIAGDAMKPSVAIDTDILGEQLHRALVDQGSGEIKDRLRGLLGGKKKP